MKSTTLLLIGGLAFAGTALAGDPTPQQTSGPSQKVGIDKTTGKLRPLTAEESAALDSQAAASAGDSRTLRAKSATARTSSRFVFPTTDAEMKATMRVVNGITVMKPPADSMSTMTVTRNADGTLIFQENGEMPVQAKQEAASE